MQDTFVADSKAAFIRFVDHLAPGRPVAVLCHNDGDGLPAGAILTRALQRAGHTVVTEVTGKGENAWSAAVRERLQVHAPQALIVADLGSRDQAILDGIPTLLIDHHHPEGVPPNATLITGYRQDPVPTAGLLAYWCVAGITTVDDLDWLAAVSLLSDIGDKAPFDLLDQAKSRYKATPLRDATSLINAPRRSASADARPALNLLLTADGPAAITRGTTPEVAQLKAAKTEVNSAFNEAKKAAPVFSGSVAMVRIHTPCQVHPLIAQIWRTRLPKYIAMGVNTGYVPGYVHFSARASRDINLITFLREHAPPDAGDAYGHGHDQASGGALRNASWNIFVRELGFGPELLVEA